MQIKKLEKWYSDHHRKLPFRESKNPYQIWVSEIMLQQTQVETVLPFFERFIFKYPNIEVLANANEEVLQKDVEGLGYYRRFKNMHLAAQEIIEKHQGLFPKTYHDLINLPGIGKYTAGAIMSIAYNKPYSALDGNVIRVLSRYMGYDQDMRLEKNKKLLDQINQENIEKANPYIYTQAMMELGALVCRPKNPKCVDCPLSETCYAYEHQMTSVLPMLSKLKQKKEFNWITLIIEDDSAYYLRKRDEQLLHNMYEYPQFSYESIQSVLDELEDKDVFIEIMDEPTFYDHVFTHQIWKMTVYHARLLAKPLAEWIRVKKEELNQLPMAIAHRKIS